MKKLLLKRAAVAIIAMFTMSMAAFAQEKGDMAAGANLLLGTGNGYSNIGLGGKFLYNITAPIRLAGEFDYFLKKNYLSMWDFSVYGHYLFPVADKITVFPAAGLGILGSTVSYPYGWGEFVPGFNSSYSGSDFALSLGGGADFQLTSNLFATGELRIKISDGTRFNIVAGVAYKF
ncbi:hypothetical protein FACS1894181_06330 [Bacteroidia bacterium]|nr:hypothetical protein FACS1894181_06330 [Bacteroidia bacterium]